MSSTTSFLSHHKLSSAIESLRVWEWESINSWNCQLLHNKQFSCHSNTKWNHLQVQQCWLSCHRTQQHKQKKKTLILLNFFLSEQHLSFSCDTIEDEVTDQQPTWHWSCCCKGKNELEMLLKLKNQTESPKNEQVKKIWLLDHSVQALLILALFYLLFAQQKKTTIDPKQTKLWGVCFFVFCCVENWIIICFLLLLLCFLFFVCPKLISFFCCCDGDVWILQWERRKTRNTEKLDLLAVLCVISRSSSSSSTQSFPSFVWLFSLTKTKPNNRQNKNKTKREK